jgi:sugar diacid utilization regulator
MGRTFDYNIAVAAAMAEAYVEVVQGDLADVESARRGLVETLLTSGSGDGPELTRRAISLGFDPQRSYVVALAVVEGSADPALPPGNRWAAQAIARASGRPERSAFVVSRETECIALLDPEGPHPAERVLAIAVSAVRQQHGSSLLAGVGNPFTGLAGFPASFQAARRALRHATASRQVIQGLADIRLFDELTVADGADAAALIPEAMMTVLDDPVMRATIEAYFDANLNVAAAAQALSLHPNSLRYRLRRVASRTGRDPQVLKDLLELITAIRLTQRRSECAPGRAGGTH